MRYDVNKSLISSHYIYIISDYLDTIYFEGNLTMVGYRI